MRTERKVRLLESMMRLLKAIAGIALGVLVAGCASTDAPSRSAPFEDSGSHQFFAPQFLDPVFGVTTPLYAVEEINVSVPDSLSVSEANGYLPSGDIVWRGDPPGDRREQVKAIFEDAFAKGTAKNPGDVPVILNVEVLRFHALTEKTRYTFGGVHSIRFALFIYSAENGMLLEEPREVQADLLGYGGSRAIAAEAKGQTQKVRITEHLAYVIDTELTDPEGFENPKLGFVQMLNNRI